MSSWLSNWFSSSPPILRPVTYTDNRLRGTCLHQDSDFIGDFKARLNAENRNNAIPVLEQRTVDTATANAIAEAARARRPSVAGVRIGTPKKQKR